MIDWARVRELHGEIGAESFAEVLEIFVEEVDEALVRLRDATDMRSRSNEFHFLKGAALNLGLTKMAEICAQGESAAAHGQDDANARAQVLTEFPAHNAIILREWMQRFDRE